MDFTLNDEQRHWVGITRRFAIERIRPRARELDRMSDPRETFPIDLLREASRLGLRTLKIPKEHGGAGVCCLTEVMVQEELAYGDIGFGMTLQHAWREGHILASGTTEAQRRRFLPVFMEDDTALLSFSISEPHAGTDHKTPYFEDLQAGPRTTAVRDGDHWVINGRKAWTTNANVAKLVVLAARTDTKVPWPDGISFFVVPTNTPGFRIERVLDKVGIRLNQNAHYALENVRIPADNLLGELNRGRAFVHRFSQGSGAKEGAKALGVARAALELAIDYGKKRVQGGQPIIRHQSIGHTLVDIATEVEMARTLVWRAASAIDNKLPEADRLENMAKVAASEVCVKAATRSLEVFGGQGVLRDNPIEKLARDALCMMHTGAGNHGVRQRLATMLFEGESEKHTIY
jgi:acyl-CoA dehydrogenase